MFSSFRLKIILWYTGVALLTLLVFRLVSLQVIRVSLYEDLDNSLRAEAEWTASLVAAYKSRGVPEDEIRDEVAERSRLSPRKEYIEIYDAAGRIYFISPNLEQPELRRHDGKTDEEPKTIIDSRGYQLRLFALNDSLHEIYVGYPLTDIEAATDEILTSFIFLIPLSLVLLIVGGIFLTSRFVRPVNDLNRYADQLMQLPLDQDLPSIAVTTKDEIGQLVRRINEIIGRMRESLRQVLSFSSLASHEVRTPLSVIRLQLEDALRPRASPRSVRKNIISTYNEILRLSRIVDDLLSLSTMQAGTFTLDRKQIQFDAVVEEFYEEALLLAQQKHISIAFRQGPAAVIEGDVLRIRQILFNLLDNSLKYTSEGGHIRLSYELENGHVVLQFADTGIGIPPEDLVKIFDLFYRRGTNTQKSRGAGLGLALVKRIAEAHGGGVSVHSEVGRGTKFTIRIPAVQGLKAPPLLPVH